MRSSRATRIRYTGLPSNEESLMSAGRVANPDARSASSGETTIVVASSGGLVPVGDTNRRRKPNEKHQAQTNTQPSVDDDCPALQAARHRHRLKRRFNSLAQFIRNTGIAVISCSTLGGAVRADECEGGPMNLGRPRSHSE